MRTIVIAEAEYSPKESTMYEDKGTMVMSKTKPRQLMLSRRK
jgi:hypothetical protein